MSQVQTARNMIKLEKEINLQWKFTNPKSGKLHLVENIKDILLSGSIPSRNCHYEGIRIKLKNDIGLR